MPRQYKKEGDVKTRIKELLKKHRWYYWMPPANGYGTLGISDFHAIRDGIFLAIEAKFGSNKPTPQQLAHLHIVDNNAGFAFVVTDKNVEYLQAWLEAFDRAQKAQMDKQDVAQEDGAMMLNALAELKRLVYPKMAPANN